MLTRMSVVKTAVFPLSKHASTFSSHETCQIENNPIVPLLSSEFINVRVLTSGGVNVTIHTNTCLVFLLSVLYGELKEKTNEN